MSRADPYVFHEANSEKRSAGNPHATFCGGWGAILAAPSTRRCGAIRIPTAILYRLPKVSQPKIWPPYLFAWGRSCLPRLAPLNSRQWQLGGLNWRSHSIAYLTCRSAFNWGRCEASYWGLPRSSGRWYWGQTAYRFCRWERYLLG